MEKRIEILTRKTGYELIIGKESYFYFSEDALLTGFIYHLGMGVKASMPMEKMERAIKLYQQDEGKMAKRFDELTAELAAAKRCIEKQTKTIQKAHNRLSYYNKKYAQIFEEDDEEE
jgi:prefoldin subunit 5